MPWPVKAKVCLNEECSNINTSTTAAASSTPQMTCASHRSRLVNHCTGFRASNLSRNATRPFSVPYRQGFDSEFFFSSERVAFSCHARGAQKLDAPRKSQPMACGMARLSQKVFGSEDPAVTKQ